MLETIIQKGKYVAGLTICAVALYGCGFSTPFTRNNPPNYSLPPSEASGCIERTVCDDEPKNINRGGNQPQTLPGFGIGLSNALAPNCHTYWDCINRPLYPREEHHN